MGNGDHDSLHPFRIGAGENRVWGVFFGYRHAYVGQGIGNRLWGSSFGVWGHFWGVLSFGDPWIWGPGIGHYPVSGGPVLGSGVRNRGLGSIESGSKLVLGTIKIAPPHFGSRNLQNR